jgi:hypothetical protein
MNHLPCFLLLLATVPVLAQDDLLQKEPDGSTLLTKQNAYAVFYSKLTPPFPSGLPDPAKVVSECWADELFAPGVDDFKRHDLLEKHLPELAAAEQQAASINNITFRWMVPALAYDFNRGGYPLEPSWSPSDRNLPNRIFIAFTKALPTFIAVSEDQARAVAPTLSHQPHFYLEVKGTIAGVATDAAVSFIHWIQPTPADALAKERDPGNYPYRIIIAPSSLEVFTPEIKDFALQGGKMIFTVTTPSVSVAKVTFTDAAPSAGTSP